MIGIIIFTLVAAEVFWIWFSIKHGKKFSTRRDEGDRPGGAGKLIHFKKS